MRIYFWGLISLPIIIFTLIFVSTYKPEINVLNSDEFKELLFADINSGGNSTSNITRTDSVVTVECVLQKGYEYPYSGIQFNKIDFSNYDLENYSVSLKLEVSYDVRLSLRMNQFIDGYTDTLNPLSYLVLVKSFGLTKGINHVVLQVDDVNEIQEWWFRLNPSMINKINEVHHNKINTLWLFTESTTPLNTKLQIKISEFSFQYSFLPLLYKFSLIAFVYYAILIVLVWKFKKVKYILMPIEPGKIENKLPDLEQKILTYIGSNFHNSELKLIDVSYEIGILQGQVSDIIKKHSGYTFRQYLNQVRMEEAKRLLRNSDLQIAEVAFKVGYNNVQHFNRVFKDYTSNTPKAFKDAR